MNDFLGMKVWMSLTVEVQRKKVTAAANAGHRHGVNIGIRIPKDKASRQNTTMLVGKKSTTMQTLQRRNGC
jgi:hypothetical protein